MPVTRRRPEDVLIVMTRLPREGRNKTRLIPALGPAGATAMHERMARHTVGRASAFAMLRDTVSLRVLVEGGSPVEAHHWLGGGSFRKQESGDLGQRLEAAVYDAFADGARRILIIGTDCPSLNEFTLAEAFDALDRADLVFAPADDGGYVLVGLSSPCAAIFHDIDWGGPDVLRQSLDAANRSHKHVHLLAPMSDVDLPEDLPAAEAALASGETLSIIIPTLNEAEALAPLLDTLLAARPHEILIADGGSTDATRETANRPGVKFIEAAHGRAVQMNHAAALATGEFLLFLHADTRPPPDFPALITRTLQTPGTSAGAFRFKLDDSLPAAPLIESLVHLRCRLRQLPYGDQGLFLRRSLFDHLGGFPEWPVMEDYQFIRILKKRGRIRITDSPAITSSRRWRKSGVVRTFLRHQLMIAAHHLGVPPTRIAQLRP
ncbi:MAG: TIGR04283 family arsenosugar biosynthesis glycosyltransferase [Luteolibacter sp.]